MKLIQKITLTLFSAIMLIGAILASILIFGWMKFTIVTNLINVALANSVYSNIWLGLNIIIIILSVICIFFDSGEKNDKNNVSGVLLENDNGKLLISKETLENLVTGVALNMQGAQNITTKVHFDEENNVMIDLSMRVYSNTVIKDVSSALQTKIKEKIKQVADLDVKSINIKIKDIANRSDINE